MDPCLVWPGQHIAGIPWLATLIEAAPFRATGLVDPFGRIDPDGDVDLAAIRRPDFFGHAPYCEEIAAAAEQTFVIEVEVPPDRHERERLGISSERRWKQRGWYIEGRGVDDGRGRQTRALAVLIAGRTGETTAIQDRRDPVWRHDAGQDRYVLVLFPTTTTEAWGSAAWRDYMQDFHGAGFDVLSIDKRARWLSGGLNSCNTVEQARDIFRALAAFETGEGLRIAGPDGRQVSGAAAAGRLLGGHGARDIPVLLIGASQGSMVASHAMHLNFVTDRSFEEAGEPQAPPLGFAIKAALCLAEFAHGVGHSQFSLVEAAMRCDFQTPFMPSGEVLAGIARWPALFLGRGLWDFGGSLEGTLDAYERVRGLREIVVARGPHALNQEDNEKHMRGRALTFARAVLRGDAHVPGAASFSNLREPVASAPPYWEETMRPQKRL